MAYVKIWIRLVWTTKKQRVNIFGYVHGLKPRGKSKMI